jgi:hypothetical protein
MSEVRTDRQDGGQETIEPTSTGSSGVDPTLSLNANLRADLKRKQALLSSACKCLDDEKSYAFFELLASLSRLEKGSKREWLDFLQTTGGYDDSEMGAITRLVMGEGATAFKGVVDMVRDIRVQQEIEAMLTQA